MPDERLVFALVWIVLGLAAGGGFEAMLRRTLPRLGILRGVAFCVAAATGIYAGSLELYAFAGKPVPPIVHQFYVAALIVAATVVGARLARAAILGYSHRVNGSVVSVSVVVSFAEILVIVVGSLVVLGYLGISITPILTAFGVGGLAVALALQSTLANFFAGVQIAASRQVHVGDFVKLENGDSGTVADINWRNTVIEDADGNRIIVPNEKLATAIFTRFRKPLRIDVPLIVKRSVELADLDDLLRRAAAEVAQRERALDKDDVSIQFAKVNDEDLELVVSLRADRPNERGRIASAFTRRVLSSLPYGNSPS